MTHNEAQDSPRHPTSGNGAPSPDACERFGEEIEALLFERPLRTAEPDGELGRHLGECSSCSDLLALHSELLAWEDSQPAPTEHEEAQLRRRVLDAIERERPARSGAPSPVRSRLALAAAVLLLLAAGFLGGRLTSEARAPYADEPGTLAREALPNLAEEPAAASGRADFASSLLDPIAASLRTSSPDPVVDRGPYSFDNVQLHDLGGDRVRLSFDYSIHLEVERERRDPLVTEVLVHAILDGGSLGTQLKAIDVAEEPELSPRLRGALIRTMLEDESAPARQAALERLLPDAGLTDVETALLQVLEHEPSVHMRLLAIDALAAGGMPAGRLEQALEAGPAEPGQALRLRVGDLRQEM